MMYKRTKFAKRVFAFMVPITLFAFVLASFTFDGGVNDSITAFDIVSFTFLGIETLFSQG